MNNPIGVFDSGVGGTSIWREIHGLLPKESTIYLADSKNAPYGEKSRDEIVELCIKNTELLLRKKCKIVVVACNTATTNAIDYLRSNYDIPFIGIEPAIKPAALRTKTKKVGVLATKGTLSSGLFYNTSKLYTEGIEIIEQEGKDLVKLIESGEVRSNEMKTLLQVYLKPMLLANIDCLVLGCTHYPYLIPILREILPNQVKIIDSGEAVARQTKIILEKNNLLNQENNQSIENIFYSNAASTKVLSSLLMENNYQVSQLDF
ncbi:glutamate racemase [Croceitalea rosinachiae]|uniref:Glutamate racemase n=1 Tax=Croceitalea rosinachiae TaxID=3075596 RepID=A0ABU3A6J7_9FLAO|nr:glutamate racemase [Croceitalea sp. F388]MDT0605594.1 glutamate racemase [Croceitalea sp. F388]